ncbi:GNAT family N-acetyltransferase [Hymenobacter sp. 15J16-1T3B]|uniref:GNAT family N-acetyltransferase n=1 Tax=Hymenobacter sp. 15J16-1T3B TaxID=2886941 RepID=UPI001D12767B|nr:GNAT family protein [Hymenobacter sp. 15J16-1T3B]MCC3156581.1 GNAT family N-acetyltransferase [Hymenobacter sp. 15J16-1T3B]
MPPTLSVRELRADDIPRIADYWLTSSPEHLTGMGVDLTKMPDRAGWTAMLTALVDTPLAEHPSYCLIWEVDGRAVGHSNINQIRPGEQAYMHLHLWDAQVRRLGYGRQLVRLTLPRFFEAYQLQRLYCEPYALNPAPNRTLAQLGFRFVREHVCTPGSLNFEQPVKLWELRREDLPARL